MSVCDIVIPVYHQPQLTRDCVASIIGTTKIPVTLYIVDNASDAETKEVIRGYSSTEHVRIEVIENAENLGFSRAVNQGLSRGKSPFALILNNDTLFTERCLDIMIGIAGTHADIGLVNPESSTFGVRPATGETADDVAKRLAPLGNNYVEFGNCIGFAMLVKREVMDKIGYLDEAFGIAYFEDTDFSMRAKAAGFRCAKACGAYIYHHEHKSLDRVPWKEELFQKNKKLYEERWGRPLRIIALAGGSIDGDQKRMSAIISDIVRLARQECYIRLYLATKRPLTKSQLFSELGMVEMANIEIVPVRPALLHLATIWRIVKKRKKKYNLIIAYEALSARILVRFSFILRITIYLMNEIGFNKAIRGIVQINDVAQIINNKFSKK